MNDEHAGLGARAAGTPAPGAEFAGLQRLEQQLRDCLHGLGWKRRTDPGADEEGADAAALALATLLDDARGRSADLLRQLEDGDAPRKSELLRAARRCHGLVEDALLLGAIDLAVRLGVPGEVLPR